MYHVMNGVFYGVSEVVFTLIPGIGSSLGKGFALALERTDATDDLTWHSDPSLVRVAYL